MSSLSQSLAQSLAQSLSNSLIKSNALSFSKGSFTNATDRYMVIKNPASGLWEMKGPVSGGTLATKIVGGKRFAQFVSAKSTDNTYSEAFRAAISDWVNNRIDVTDNIIMSPVNTLTGDTEVETVDLGTHRLYQSFATDGLSTYFFGAFVKSAGRTKCALYYLTTGIIGDPQCYFNLSTGVAYNASDCDYYGIIPVANDWYYVYISATSDAVDTGYAYIYNVDATDQIVYSGDVTKGLSLWGANIIKSSYLTSYIYAGAVTGDINKDQFAWSEAVVNAHSWIRDGFKCTLSMSHATDEMLADDGGEHVIAAYDTTGAKGVVELYFDGADKKIKWRDDDTGALGESVALNCSLGDQIKLEWTLDNGSNSTLAVDGGGVDTTYNGTQTAAADGPLHYGMDDSQALQFDLGHISEPEPL